MTLNPHSLLPSVLLAIISFVGISVLIHNYKSRLNIYFFFVCLTIAFWNGYYITYNLDINNQYVYLFSKICYCLINFIPIAMLAFIGEFLKLPFRILNFVNLCYGILISNLILTTPYIINGLYIYPWGHYPKAGIYHPFYLLYFFFMLLTFYSTLFYYIYIKPINEISKLNQCKYIFVAFLLLIIGAIDYIPNYGIKIYPIGHFFATMFISLIGYAIFKHKLLDIQIFYKKSIVYSSLVTSITSIYLISVISFEHFFHNFIGYKNIFGSITTAIVIAVVFIPLKNKIQDFANKLFLKRNPYEIEEENQNLRQEIIQSEKLRSIAVLASGMAHEIKNPLTALKTFSEYLPRKIDDKEFLKKFAPIIANEVNRIDALVHELLDFAKPAPVNLKPLNLISIINGTLDILNNDFIKNKIHLNKDFRINPSVTMPLDANQFKQALLNILLNAIEAMPYGGNLTIDITEKSHHLLIRIQDTGVGIEKADIQHIFDPFYTKKDHGTGLGLSITHEIIKNHNGRIFVESTVGGGTTFIIELPYSSPL